MPGPGLTTLDTLSHRMLPATLEGWSCDPRFREKEGEASQDEQVGEGVAMPSPHS